MPSPNIKLTNVVLFLLLLVQTFVFAVTAIYNYSKSKKNFYQELNDNITTTTARLANNLAVPLWNYNDISIYSTLEAELNSTYIDAIIISVDGKIEYQLTKNEKGEIVYKLKNNQYELIKPENFIAINYENNDGSGKVGDLLILADDSLIKENLDTLVKNLFIQSVILNLSLAILILLILYKLVIDPINRTNKGLKKIVSEGTNLSKRLPEDSIGELGELAKNYNRVAEYVSLMLADIETQKINLQAIFNNALDGIILFDSYGNMSNVNPAACNIFGYSEDTLIHANITLFVNRDHAKSIIKEIQKNYRKNNLFVGHTQEIMATNNNGEEFPIALSISKMHDLDESQYIGLIRDISQQKNLEQEREHALEKAQESTKLKSEFLASMSHEIRTPMNGVIGMLRLMLDRKLSKQQRHYATLAKSSADALLVLINDILDFSKIEAGKLEMEVIDFDLCTLLGELAETHAMKAQEKGLELILDLKEVSESHVRGDPGRLRQVLTNILGNAIKFTNEGEVLIKAGLNETTDQTMRFYCHIIDTGIGIPEEKQCRLFKLFSQVDASTTRKYGGTGLGLAISKQLCELMGGHINVKSTEGEGSCFSIDIHAEKSQQSSKILAPIDLKNRTILIVDENPTSLKSLAEQLNYWQATIITAESSLEALALLTEKNTIQMAIIDSQLSDIESHELGAQMERHHPDIKKVMMTSIINPGDSELIKASGFIAKYPKPITIDDFFNALNTVFDSEEPSALGHQSNDDSASDHNQSKRVLLVEDNVINQEIAIATIEAFGFTTDLAENGLQAIDKLKSTPEASYYSLIFMDCQMPEMDGYQATQAIRKGDADNDTLGKAGRHANIPIIAMTANAMKGDKEKCIAAGMDDYLTKPIDPMELKSALDKWTLNPS